MHKFLAEEWAAKHTAFRPDAKEDFMMVREGLSRRDLLQKCVALGGLTVAPSLAFPEVLLAFEEQERTRRKPTPWNEVGPFYKKVAPHTTMLRAPGDPGLPLAVSGRVYDVRGEVIPLATIEVWQTDHLGHYDLNGYRYRATLTVDGNGKYSFESVMPGHYPDRVCQHVHYLVRAPGCKPLSTQLYFATDPVFQGDPDHNYTRDPLVLSRELVRPVTLSGEPNLVHAAVEFEIVLERS